MNGLTRRAFTGSFFAPFVLEAHAATGPSNAVDIATFGASGRGDVDSTSAFQQAIMSGARRILVPRGGVFKIDGSVELRDCELEVLGTLQIGGSLQCRGRVSVFGDGIITGASPKAPFQILAHSDVSISGVTFSKCSGLSCILIQPHDYVHVERINITGCKFENSNFGILRQASKNTGAVDSLVIASNHFENLRGDAIEINCAVNDRGIIIDSNEISNVDNSQKKPFWGIGIGLAGSKYSDVFSEADSIKRFVVSNNKLRNLRQAIHVECGTEFSIVGNEIRNVSAQFSPDSGLEVRGIVTYGCNDFDISKNTIISVTEGYAIDVAPGSMPSSLGYRTIVATSRDFRVLGNSAEVGGAMSFKGRRDAGAVQIVSNRCDSLRYKGLASKLTMVDNIISGSNGLGVEIDPQHVPNTSDVDICRNIVRGKKFDMDRFVGPTSACRP